MPDPDIDDLHDILRRVSHPQCPGCQRKTTWLITTEAGPAPLAYLPTVKAYGEEWHGAGIPSVFMVCQLCGFIRVHSAKVLLEIAKDAKRKGGNGSS